MLLIMGISSLSSTMLCRAMALIPGNSQFQVRSNELDAALTSSQDRHELVSLAKYYFNKWGYYITLLLFILSLQSINIAAIIESAQVRRLSSEC